HLPAHGEFQAIDLAPVECGNGRVAIAMLRHINQTGSGAAPAVMVRRHNRLKHPSKGCKKFCEGTVIDRVGQIRDLYLSTHRGTLPETLVFRRSMAQLARKGRQSISDDCLSLIVGQPKESMQRTESNPGRIVLIQN